MGRHPGREAAIDELLNQAPKRARAPGNRLLSSSRFPPRCPRSRDTIAPVEGAGTAGSARLPRPSGQAAPLTGPIAGEARRFSIATETSGLACDGGQRERSRPCPPRRRFGSSHASFSRGHRELSCILTAAEPPFIEEWIRATYTRNPRPPLVRSAPTRSAPDQSRSFDPSRVS